MTNPNIVLGICSERNAAAALMIDDRIVGMIQEERLTKRKNQIGFPKRAIDRLVATHLDGAPDRIDRVAFSFLKHLASYAVGRSLSYNELVLLEEKGVELRKEGYRMKDMVRWVIKSDLFMEK